MAHPLVWNTAGVISIKAIFEVELRIERPVWLGHQPTPPLDIFLADLCHFRPATPARAVIVPFDFYLADFTANSGTEKFIGGDLIRFAATLCAHLYDQFSFQHCIPRGLGFF